MPEHEYRILEINVSDIIKKLESLGALKVQDSIMKRMNFGIGEERGKFIRLRDEGGRITLAYKHRYYEGKNERTHEIEIIVDDFQNTLEFLQAIGFEVDEEQEQKRIKYVLDGIEFCLDTWPGIPTYLEVEGRSDDDALRGLSMLGFTKDDTTYLAGKELLIEKYGLSVKKLKRLIF